VTAGEGRVAGRVAIVTGAATGNGRAIARCLAREGASVACADLDGDGAEVVAAAIRAAGGRALATAMDHTLAADCERTVAEAEAAFGQPDILVNNAGVAILATALNTTEEDFTRQWRINVLGPFLLSRAVLPGMIERGGGAIVMIASAAGLQPRQAGAPYVSSKHALVGLMKSLAADYAADGVRVNAVCPALVRTRMAQQLFDHRAGKSGLTPEAVEAEMRKEFPLGRLGEPDDVATATLNFAADDAGWLTGQALLLDGGQSLLGPRAPLPRATTGSG